MPIPGGPVAVNVNTGAVSYDGAPSFAPGSYYITNSPGSTSTASIGQGILRLLPWYIQSGVSLTRIGAEVTAAGDAGSKFRLGIYADNGSGYPGALVLDAGQINGDSNTVQEVTITQSLTPGLYWIGGATQSVSSTAPTYRVVTTWHPTVPMSTGASAPTAGQLVVGYQQSSVTGGLPATFTTSVTVAGNGARCFVKTA